MLWPSPSWESLTYWALDLETGGLDPRKDPIIAVGMVPVRAGAIRLGEAWQTLVRPEAAVDPASIRAHQLLPRDVAAGTSVVEALAEIEGRLREGVLLVHQAAIDVAFLKRACKRSGQKWLGAPVVDTVALLLKAAKRAQFLDPDAPALEPNLNLLRARTQYGLPDYGQHDALTDAIATAELFLVLRRQLAAKTLRDLR